jgi:ferredoxin-type protein NapH
MTPAIAHLGRDAIAANGWLGAHKFLILRRASQLAILALFMVGPIAGLWILKGNLSSSLIADTVPMTDPLQFAQILATGHFAVAGAAVTGAALVFGFYLLVGGRVFCAWVCPVNMVTDGAQWLRRRLAIKGSAQIRRGTRYWMLGAVLILAAITAMPAYELVNPVSMAHRGIIFGFGAGWTIILGVLAFDLFVMKRGWCGHLCPTGAFYGLIGRASLVRVRADNRMACDDCRECYEVCPEPQVITPALKGARHGAEPADAAILSGACTNCGRCIDICPHDVFNFGLRFATPADGRRRVTGSIVEPGRPGRS